MIRRLLSVLGQTALLLLGALALFLSMSAFVWVADTFPLLFVLGWGFGLPLAFIILGVRYARSL